MIILYFYYYFLFLFIFSFIKCNNLYERLNISKSSSLNEIKKAYRTQAKLTHPDKNSHLNIDEVNHKFHLISEAYEILSDEITRREYDRTGKTPKEIQEELFNSRKNQQRNSPQNNNQYNSFHRFNNKNNFYSHQHEYQPNVKYHPYYFQIRRQIILCQQLVISVTGYSHFMNLVLDSENSRILQRYVILAIYDSSSPECSNYMNYQIMYPYPFAGFTRSNDQTMNWDEILITLKLDINSISSQSNKHEIERLLNHFDLSFEDIRSNCPMIVFLTRNQLVDDYIIWNYETKTSLIEYRDWIWSKLKMRVKIVNKTPWIIHHWWLDGMRAKKLSDIPVKHSYNLETFISHAFLYRPSIVEGKMLNNQVR